MRNFDPFSRVYYPLDVVDKFKNALYLVVEFNWFFTKLLDRRKIGLLPYMTIVLNDIASDRRLRFPLDETEESVFPNKKRFVRSLDVKWI